jgi:hypothetical protein
MKDGYLRGGLRRRATTRQVEVPAAFVASGGSVPKAADLIGIRPSTVKRHLVDLRLRSGLSTDQLIYVGRSAGWLVVPSMELVNLEASPWRGTSLRVDASLNATPPFRRCWPVSVVLHVGRRALTRP